MEGCEYFRSDWNCFVSRAAYEARAAGQPFILQLEAPELAKEYHEVYGSRRSPRRRYRYRGRPKYEEVWGSSYYDPIQTLYNEYYDPLSYGLF